MHRKRKRKPKLNGAILKVGKLELERGDTLVLSTDLLLTRMQVDELRKRAAPLVPKGVKVMIVTAGIKLAVLRDSHAARMRRT